MADACGDGPPIVLLHSGGHDRRDFDAIVPTLARRFRVIALDLPGHGESHAFEPPSRAGARAIYEGVEDALVALDLAPAVVIGNSVGGMAALHVAAARPERVRALILVSPSGLVEMNQATRTVCWLMGREIVRRQLGMAIARRYMVQRSALTDAILARMEARRRDDAFIAMEAALWRSFGRAESDLADRVASIHCPTVLVWGEHDPVIRARVEGRRARRLLPGADWVSLPLGHVPFAEDAAAFLAAIEPFLAPLSAEARPADAGSAIARGAPA